MNFFFSHGRTAFKYGLKSLNLKKNDSVMLPEYICDVLLDPLKDLGIKPIFYEINNDFTTNWQSLKKRYKKSVKALVIINYFGFEEQKKAFNLFCKQKKIFLIEDNCHSLNIDKNKIDNQVDITFYSIRKILKDTYCGGLLKIKKVQNESIFVNSNLKKNNVSIKMIVNNILENKFLKFKRFLKYIFFKMPKYSVINFIQNDKINEDFLIDDHSKLIFEKTKFTQTRNFRYRNYLIWQKLCKNNKYFEGIERKINKQNIPWVYPVYVNDIKVRNAIFKFGWKNGYTITSWPSLPKNLINKKNKRIWNKLICFNTDRAPVLNNLEFNNIIYRSNG